MRNIEETIGYIAVFGWMTSFLAAGFVGGYFSDHPEHIISNKEQLLYIAGILTPAVVGSVPLYICALKEAYDELKES